MMISPNLGEAMPQWNDHEKNIDLSDSNSGLYWVLLVPYLDPLHQAGASVLQLLQCWLLIANSLQWATSLETCFRQNWSLRPHLGNCSAPPPQSIPFPLRSND